MRGLSIMLRPTAAMKRSEPTSPFIFIDGDHPRSLHAKDPEDFVAKLRIFLDDMNNLKYLDHLHFVETDDLSNEERTRLENYKKAAGKTLALLKSSFGSFEDSLLGVKNLFVNMDIALEKPGINHIHIDKPFDAIVVSAGPSLDLEFETLRKLQKNYLIVSVDAAFKTLLNEGIIPHFAVVIERDDYSIPFFKNLPKNLSTCLIAHSLVDRQIFKNYTGPIVTALKYTGPCLWLPIDRTRHWTGSSSSHVAFRTAAALGARRIALVGQDLCFHPETFQSHTTVPDYPQWSAPSSLEKRRNESSVIEVEGNLRDRVYTKPTWTMFLNDLQIMLQETKIPTTNTSKLGMKIPGCPFESLDNWAEKNPATSTRPIRLTVPQKNPLQREESQKLLKKRDEAVVALEKMKQEIQSERNIEELYQEIPTRTHFLELCLELVFRDWVEVENKLLPLEKDDPARRPFIIKFLGRCEMAIDRVLEALSFKI